MVADEVVDVPVSDDVAPDELHFTQDVPLEEMAAVQSAYERIASWKLVEANIKDEIKRLREIIAGAIDKYGKLMLGDKVKGNTAVVKAGWGYKRDDIDELVERLENDDDPIKKAIALEIVSLRVTKKGYSYYNIK